MEEDVVNYIKQDSNKQKKKLPSERLKLAQELSNDLMNKLSPAQIFLNKLRTVMDIKSYKIIVLSMMFALIMQNSENLDEALELTSSIKKRIIELDTDYNKVTKNDRTN